MVKNIVFGDEFYDLGGDKLELFNTLPFKWFLKTKNKKVLEMGCGTGVYIYPFVKQNNNVIGIEIDKRRLDIAKKKTKARLIQGDIRKMPFEENSFDIIFCHGVIEHFPESQKGIDEGFRILKKGGKAMYSVPSKLSFFTPLKIIQQAIDKTFNTNLWTCGYEKSFSPGKFKKMLRKSGFKIREFEIDENAPGRRFPIVGKVLKILDKPFYWSKTGGRFMYALCEKS